MTGDALRVVHLVCTDAFAGVERYVSTLAREQAARGLDVTVIGGSGEHMPETLGADVAWYPGTTITASARRQLRMPRPDLVHAHMTAAELAATLTRPVVRAPVVVTRHFAQRRGASLPGRIAGRLIARSLAGQIAISEVVAERAEGECAVIHTGTSDVAETVPAFGREPVVLVLQRLEREKRTDLALRVWQHAGLAARGWTLRIAGDGAEAAALHALAGELGVADSCEWLGEQKATADLFRRAGLFLAPSPNDGFGLAVVEAMAAAVPVVAAAAGGHLETVGACPQAAMFDPDEPGHGGELLAALAADPARRDAYGASLQRLQRDAFSITRQVEETIAFYRKVSE